MNCDSISRRSRGFGIIITVRDCSDNVVDLSTATNIEITFKYGVNNLSETATLVNDGSDGKVVFVTPTDSEYFNADGNWIVEVIATFTDGQYPSTNTVISVVA